MIQKTLSLVLATLVLAACGSTEAAPAKPKTTEVEKEISVPIDGAALLRTGIENPGDDAFQAGVTQCWARDNLVVQGDQVVIRDAAGATIAFGELGEGTLGEGDAPISSPCVFTVDIEDVPLGEKFYEIQVGETTPVTLTEEDLVLPAFKISLG